MKKAFFILLFINLLFANPIKIDKSITAQQDYLSHLYQEFKDYIVLKNFIKINNLIFNYYKKNNFNIKNYQDRFLLSNIKYMRQKFNNPYLIEKLKIDFENTQKKIINKNDLENVKLIVIKDIPYYLKNINLYKKLIKNKNFSLIKKIYKQAVNYFSTNFTYIKTNEQIQIFYLINQDSLTKILIKEKKN